MTISIVVLTHNRLESLKRCIKSIRENTIIPYEIIIVDNASSDGTKEWLIEQEEVEYTLSGPSEKSKFKAILNQINEGVCARNKALELISGEYWANIDDDVIVHKGWDTTALEYINTGDNVGLVCVQGGIMKSWYEHSVWEYNKGYADFATGYFFVAKNLGKQVHYDTALGNFWREDDDLSFQYKSLGYKIRVMPMLCTHASMRSGPIDWERHNGNTEYVKNKWADKLDKLRLGGN